MFERFFRTAAATEQSIPGVGLGLSIVQAIAAGHGGSVGVESEEGRGTTFHVELPIPIPEVTRDELTMSARCWWPTTTRTSSSSSRSASSAPDTTVITADDGEQALAPPASTSPTWPCST